MCKYEACRKFKGTRETSSLVRRLTHEKCGSGRDRIRQWFCEINDQTLVEFGLTEEEIVLLRETQRSRSGLQSVTAKTHS